jgi:hypothetical protein
VSIPGADLTGRAIAAIAEQAQKRVPAADLDERDPDYIRETLPGLWMLASLYFRAEVRGLQNIPGELYEAAEMEGASVCLTADVGRICLPSHRPPRSQR